MPIYSPIYVQYSCYFDWDKQMDGCMFNLLYANAFIFRFYNMLILCVNMFCYICFMLVLTKTSYFIIYNVLPYCNTFHFMFIARLTQDVQ